ncbi:MAG: hypothetical protein VB948_14910 [Pseudomonadales bacterium]|jgi:hypothetical protein
MTPPADRARGRIPPFVENIAEATGACLITMVQGNLLALTLTHWLIASQTGIAAGVVTSAAILLSRTNRRWIVSAVLGVATAVADFVVHPGGFGPVFLEALVTGAGAALLSHLVGIAVRYTRNRALLR